MNNKNFQTIFDCGSSKIRASIFSEDDTKKTLYTESEFFINQSNLESKVQKIISSFEKDTDEYIDNINLMIDSTKMLSIGISISKKLDGSQLKKENIQFLAQEAKQQVLKYYAGYNIAHFIINNYKIDNIDYSYLPRKTKCHFISIDILFICLPTELVTYYKNIFSKSNILINQTICSSYVKSINYKDNLNLSGHVSFIDIGFNKTSIISYFDDKILSLDVLPVGGNHITKDIAEILEKDLEKSEQIKLNFDQNLDLIEDDNFSIEKVQKIIFARTEEILELCTKSIEVNSITLGECKMIFMGEGSKILDNYYKDKISLTSDIEFLEETLEDICQSGFKFRTRLNKQEVVVIPKKQTKQGFFEKLFHYFS
jgi:cell division protein FtsA